MTTWDARTGGGVATRLASALETILLNYTDAKVLAGRTYYPEDFGATGVGDDTTALNNAFTAMLAGDTLLIRAGKVYRHSSTLDITKAGINIVGRGEIRATVETDSAVWLHADDIYVEDVLFTCPTLTTRGSTLFHEKIALYACSGVRLNRVRVVGSKDAGIFMYGASNYILNQVAVTGSLADGIHNTNGSNNGKIYAPKCVNVGDDGVAVVSYDTQPICHDIEVYSPKVLNALGGRGVSIVGGQDVHYYDVDVNGTNAAGIYIACESGSNTLGVAHCSVRGRVKNANTLVGSGQPDHGSVYISSARAAKTVTDVVVAADMQDSWTGASQWMRLDLGSGTASLIHFGPSIVRGTGPATVFTSNAAGSAYKTVAPQVEA